MIPAYVRTPPSDHGHVYPRQDGTKADCGGPRHCKACRDDLVALFEADQHGKGTLQHQYLDPRNVLAQLMEAMKAQLLIVFTNRLGGTVEVPVSEVDATGQWMLGFNVDQARGVFTFRTEKKS